MCPGRVMGPVGVWHLNYPMVQVSLVFKQVMVQHHCKTVKEYSPFCAFFNPKTNIIPWKINILVLGTYFSKKIKWNWHMLVIWKCLWHMLVIWNLSVDFNDSCSYSAHSPLNCSSLTAGGINGFSPAVILYTAAKYWNNSVSSNKSTFLRKDGGAGTNERQLSRMRCLMNRLSGKALGDPIDVALHMRCSKKWACLVPLLWCL